MDLITPKCPSCGSDRISTNEKLLGACPIRGFYIEGGELRHEHADDGTNVSWDSGETDSVTPYMCRTCGAEHTTAAMVAALPDDVRDGIEVPDARRAEALRIQLKLGELLADLEALRGEFEDEDMPESLDDAANSLDACLDSIESFVTSGEDDEEQDLVQALGLESIP